MLESYLSLEGNSTSLLVATRSLIEAQPSQTAAGANALSLMGTSKLESVQGLHLTNCELQIAEERVLGM